MPLKNLRKLFSHRDDREYSDRRRDEYMDVLKEIQAGKTTNAPSSGLREVARSALQRLTASRTR